MTANAVPAEFLAFLGRKYAGRMLTEQELSIVEETWAMALVPKRSMQSIEEIATAHVKRGIDPLLERLTFVSGVIRDTLDKLTGEVPPELQWAASGRNLRILGIYRLARSGGVPREITADIRSGKAAVEKADLVRVVTGLSSVQFGVPLASLSNNPTAIAQATRAACKAHAEQLQADAFRAAKMERVDLTSRIARLQSELVELNEKIAVHAADEQVQYDETMARATVKADARAAASAARRAAESEQAAG